MTTLKNASMKQIAAFASHVDRLRNRMADYGLKVEVKRPIKKITNVRWHYGRMQDGTIHYDTMQVWVSGNTFFHRATLKELGFRWNPNEKVWHQDVKTADAKHGGTSGVMRKLVEAYERSR